MATHDRRTPKAGDRQDHENGDARVDPTGGEAPVPENPAPADDPRLGGGGGDFARGDIDAGPQEPTAEAPTRES